LARQAWKVLRIVAWLACACASSRVLAQRSPAAPADLLLLGGRIFTADPAHPWATAIAIRDGRVAAVGSDVAVAALGGPRTRRIALGGRLVIPGLNDAHLHLGGGLPGVAFRTRSEDPSWPEVVDSVRALASRQPAGGWIRATIDAAVLDARVPYRAELDAVAPRHPVWLSATTGHGAILNSAALARLELGDHAADPAGGWFERASDASGAHLSGLLQEYAAWNAARRRRAMQSDSAVEAGFRRTSERAVRFGITSVQDMANALDPVTTARILSRTRLPLRVRVIAMPGTGNQGRLSEDWSAAQATGGVPANPPPPAVHGRKWILDGTGIERLALLRSPYADRPGWYGRINFPPDTLRALLREALSAHEQPVLHAIGDSTIVLTLAAMETSAEARRWRALRPRLEHAEWLTPDVFARARRLGVVVVENPGHFTDGAALMQARFGSDRARLYQPFRSLASAGIPLAIGSDGVLDPFVNLQLAVTHPDQPSEALSLAQALRAYTWGGAYAEHTERWKGVLAAGFVADLVVLSRNLFELPPDRYPGTESLLTLVGGRVVYASPEFAAQF
jgi:predicted amidohydrolase YtcJ